MEDQGLAVGREGPTVRLGIPVFGEGAGFTAAAVVAGEAAEVGIDVGPEKGRVHIYSLPVEGGAPKLLAKGGTTGGVDVAGNRIVFTRQSLLAREA